MKTALIALLLLSAAARASAQDTALVFELGETDASPSVMGGFEIGFSPRVSLRPSFMWTKERMDRRVTIHWDVIRAWSVADTWRPFISGGVGFHLFRSRGAIDDTLSFGAAISVGIERTFPKSRMSIISELQYFLVEQGATRSPSAMSARIGLKRVF